MVKPFIPPLPSARPSSVASSSAAAGSAAADQPPVGKENTANVTLSSSFGTGKSAKVGVGSRGISTTTSRASATATDATTSHSITEDLTGASASSSSAVARTPARSALGGRPPKTGGSAIRSSSASAAASSTPLAAPTPGGDAASTSIRRNGRLALLPHVQNHRHAPADVSGHCPRRRCRGGLCQVLEGRRRGGHGPCRRSCILVISW